ncbi:RecA family protein [Riemerella columbipharyngis]|uniref:Uncharacterized protein n=1 Tax=Riemerella columbipharyngis TaxID=1071918 RepID=A0A1G7A2A9_9FLAO|nr:hypothetical protein [Riemerella columbipharyngis]SDE08939.1 hypothetical protein SAMN05421544_10317 [Riemerella columbipharyngis]
MQSIIRLKDIKIPEKELYELFKTATILDHLLSSHCGLPKGVNYMLIGDPVAGKTTVALDMVANIIRNHPRIKVLFISAEMNEIDLSIYLERFSKFGNIPTLFVKSDITQNTHYHKYIQSILDEGWDIVLIDSFLELQGIIKEEESITNKTAESWLLTLIKKHNIGKNKTEKNISFITIQQVTKSGAFVGSNRLKHMITAMMELRLTNTKNPFSDRYIIFSKHRRGVVGQKLYYDLSCEENIWYDEERYHKGIEINQMNKEAKKQNFEMFKNFSNLFKS